MTVVMTQAAWNGLHKNDQYALYVTFAKGNAIARDELERARRLTVRTELYIRRLEAALLVAGRDLPERPWEDDQ